MKRIVLVGGCFDVLHFGHIHFLSQAKALGDILLVALESDENVKIRKGQTRPIHSQKQRKTMLEALVVVDEVIPLPFMKTNDDYTALVTRIKPTVIAVTHGDPYVAIKTQQATSVGAKLVEISLSPTPSTTQLAKLLGLE